ncbi:MAG: hypothetical protein Ct9H300mP21_05670 [Pseudomonadota bacterium]|nr:MAG: hypothetical protein Ct9H300mP21_05670 [Pseudomonadota bacterium]
MFRRIAKRNEKSELLSDGGQLRWNWQFPQGGIDLGESEEETLFRELEEEIGTNDVKSSGLLKKKVRFYYPLKCCIFFINNLMETLPRSKATLVSSTVELWHPRKLIFPLNPLNSMHSNGSHPAWD